MNGGAALRVPDVARLLHGQVGWPFVSEALFRIVFVYLLLLISMRLMGRRMAAMLNRSELAALVSLAAATGAIIGSPDRGLLPPVLICTMVVGVEYAQAQIARRNKRAERAMLGDLSILVRDGELDLVVMKTVSIPRERVLSQLRSEGYTQLGAIQRLYMEADGGFSLIKLVPPRPGLSIIPVWDKAFADLQQSSAAVVACARCGHTEPGDAHGRRCARCGNEEWRAAVT